MDSDRQNEEARTLSLAERGVTGNMERRPGLREAVLLYLAVFVLLIFGGTALQLLHPRFGMMLGQVLLILLPALFFWKRFRIDKGRFARLKSFPIKFVPTIFLLTISMWVVNMVIAVVLVTVLVKLGYQPSVLIEPPASIREYLFYLVLLALFAGVCEELLFRGTIMPSLEEHGLVPAIVFSSFLFALVHLSFLNFVSSFSLGIVIAVIVIKTGSIWAGVLYHFLNNAIAVTYLYAVGGGEAAPEAELSLLSLIALLPLFLLALAFSYLGFFLLQRQTTIKPLLGRGQGLLPRGWISWPVIISLFIYLGFALLELAIGFGWLKLGL